MSDLKHILPLLIPIVAIVMGIGIGMLALVIDYKRKRELFELHHKERMLAIERGIDVPPLPAELFHGGRQAGLGVPAAQMHRGLVWLLVGLAVMAALALNRDLEAAAWGLIPVAVGVANLIAYALGQRGAPTEGKTAPLN